LLLSKPIAMAKNKCAYEDCDKLEQQAGVCLLHYWEEYRSEDKFDADELWEFVKKELKING